MTRRKKSIMDAIEFDLDAETPSDDGSPPVPPPVHPHVCSWKSHHDSAAKAVEWRVRGSLPRPVPGSAVWVHSRDGQRALVVLGDFYPDSPTTWEAAVKLRRQVVTHPELDWYIRRSLPFAREVLSQEEVETPAFQLAKLVSELARFRGIT